MDRNDNLFGLYGLIQMILGFATFAIVVSDMFGYKLPKNAKYVVIPVYIILFIVYLVLLVKLKNAGYFRVSEEKKESIKEKVKGKK